MTTTTRVSRQHVTRPAPDEDVTGFAERASAVLRELRDSSRPDWRTVFETGLQEAYRINDMRGLAAIVHYAVQPLGVACLFAEAIIEIDHVLTMVNGDPDASAMLLGLKAGFCLGTGAVAEATISVREAEPALAQATDLYATNRAAWYIAAVRCRAMLPAALPELEAVL